MPISNCVEHYFFGGGLRLRVGSSLCWEWLDWPILGDHVAASCSRGMQTAQRTDVDETLDTVPQHAIDNILCAADSSALMFVGAALHRRADVVNNFRTSYGPVYGGGISEVADKNLDVAILHPFRVWLSSNEEADTVPSLEKPPNQMSADQTMCSRHQNLGIPHSRELGLKFDFRDVGLLRDAVRPVDSGARLFRRNRHRRTGL